MAENSPEAFSSSPVFSPKFALHPMESLVYLLYWIFNHLCLREIKEGKSLFKIRVQPSPLCLFFSLKCTDWLNSIFLASFEFRICQLRRYTIAAEIGVFPKVSGGLVWACIFFLRALNSQKPCAAILQSFIHRWILAALLQKDSWQQLLNSSARIQDIVALFPVHPHLTLDFERYSTADLESYSCVNLTFFTTIDCIKICFYKRNICWSVCF